MARQGVSDMGRKLGPTIPKERSAHANPTVVLNGQGNFERGVVYNVTNGYRRPAGRSDNYMHTRSSSFELGHSATDVLIEEVAKPRLGDVYEANRTRFEELGGRRLRLLACIPPPSFCP